MCHIRDTGHMDAVVEKYTHLIREACAHSMPTKKTSEKLTLPWWSEDLVKMKKRVTTLKRRIRNAAPVRRSKVVEEYLKHKEEYEKAAAKAQTESWKEFCGKQCKETMWEGIYRVIGRTERREEDLPLAKEGKVLDAKQSAEYLANTFYGRDHRESESPYHRQIRDLASAVNEGEQDGACDPPLTTLELRVATESFNPRKAPGQDGLTADICSQVIGSSPETYLALTNKCLELGYFPRAWKEAIVVILRKPGKDDYTSPKSYRPIGLLPVLGKIFEKMLVARLRFYILPRTSTRQYGFMPQRGTEDSLYVLMQHIRKRIKDKKIVTVISLDIEGAFDNAWWPAIRVRLAEEKCPVNLRRVIDSYLDDRRVRVRYAGEEFPRSTEKGCVQGSIGGPTLWNLLLDPLLRILQDEDYYVQAFADDIVLVIDGNTAVEIERQANAALGRVQQWGVKNKLKFAPHKTNAITLTNKLKYDTPRLSMDGVDIIMAKEVKILGVTIDDKLTFNKHVSNVCRRAVKVHKQLCRAAKVSWGLNPEVVKTIYVTAIEPIVLYGAAAWAPAAAKVGVRKQLAAVQRGVAQQICKAYRTVSLNAALLLAGILPLDLRVQEVASLYEAKKGVPQPVLRGREVERMASALGMPHPAGRIDMKLIGLVNQEQVDANNDLEVKIFTDGSKIGGRVGAALSVWTNGTETRTHKLSLPDYGTVYQAELLAICRATRVIQKSRATSFGIFSDSMAALQTVINHSCLHPLAVEARENIELASPQNKMIRLFWVKAHAGLEGNERVDQLAKEAAADSKRVPDYDACPVSFIKRHIRSVTLDEWSRRYASGETAATTKIFFPNAVAAYRTIGKLKLSGDITQVLTGHGGFSEYLTRFKCKENPSCVCDPAQLETAKHVIFDCPAHAVDRFDLEQELGEDITPENAGRIMAGKGRDRLVEFCKKVVKILIARNKT